MVYHFQSICRFEDTWMNWNRKALANGFHQSAGFPNSRLTNGVRSGSISVFEYRFEPFSTPFRFLSVIRFQLNASFSGSVFLHPPRPKLAREGIAADVGIGL